MFVLFGSIVTWVKRGLIVFVVYGLIVLLYTSFTRPPAQKTTKVSPEKKFELIKAEFINSQKQAKTPEQKTTVAAVRFVSCVFAGELCTDNPRQSYFDNSLIGMPTNLIAKPFQHPPASGIAWLRQGLEQNNIIPKTYAAEGMGFASISGYTKIWSLFRNMTYLVLVFFVVAVGFLIMFRFKINPQTVVTIENTLPRIVIALIMITFSFAIAGLLIDLMYVLIAISIASFSQLQIGDLTPSNAAMLTQKYTGAGLGDLWPYSPAQATQDAFVTGAALFGILPNIIKLPIRGIITLGMGNLMVEVIHSLWGDAPKALNNITLFSNSLGEGPGNLLTFMIRLILYFVISGFVPAMILGFMIIITLLFLMFRLLGLVLKSYIAITLMIIFAPLIIAQEILPGKHAFSGWVKTLIAELLTFPLLIIITLVGYAILHLNYEGSTFMLPFLYGVDPSDVSVLIGMGLVLIIPDILARVKSSMGVKDSGFNFGPGTYLAGGLALLGGARAIVGAGYSSMLSGYKPESANLLSSTGKGGGIDSGFEMVANPQAWIFRKVRDQIGPLADAASRNRNNKAGSGK